VQIYRHNDQDFKAPSSVMGVSKKKKVALWRIRRKISIKKRKHRDEAGWKGDGGEQIGEQRNFWSGAFRVQRTEGPSKLL